MSSIVITGNDLTLEQLALICRENAKIELAEEAKQNIIEFQKSGRRLSSGGESCLRYHNWFW